MSTNDPDNPQVALTVQGIVKKQVEAVPGEVAFGDVKRGTEDTKELLVNDLNPARGTFSVGPVSNSNSSIKVEQLKRPDGKPGALIKVSLLKTMPVGPFDDTIKITTNRVPLQVDVFGTVTRRFEYRSGAGFVRDRAARPGHRADFQGEQPGQRIR